MIWTRTFRRVLGRDVPAATPQGRRTTGPVAVQRPTPAATPIDIGPGDPLLAYFHGTSGPVAIDSIDLDSPALRTMRAAGVKLVVPLISQGELLGLLNLGPRLSDQEYSGDDRRLLERLSTQAAPALRVAQLVREQELEVRSHERVEQELRVAQLIQQQFLPKKLPDLPGWQVAAFYRPAVEVGGDFYDFIELPNGAVGLVCGDVTGHGVPAALVMATTRSILRGDAPRLVSPSKVLERANTLLHGDIPSNMFVTCLFAVLDPRTGRIRYANAGHDVPYVHTANGVAELRARGMPLGLMPGMEYEEKEAVLAPGESILLHSDGLAEAHNAERQMFGFPRLKQLVAEHAGGQKLIDELLTALDHFTPPGWQQEDDITLVTLSRSAGVSDEEVLVDFMVESVPGNERQVMDRVAKVVDDIGLAPERVERLKTAVAEAAMNAIEHGNKGQRELLVAVRVAMAEGDLIVRITDQGGGAEIPEAETPDLEAKLAGLQKPRGWGLFLIKNMVDDLRVHTDERHHTVELVLHLNGDGDGDNRN